MEPPLSNVSQETLDQITTHLVLPRQLPSLLDVKHERKLVGLVLDAIGPTYKLAKMFQKFQQMHPLVDADAIATELRNLKPCEMLGFYIRKQNCCLTVYRAPATASVSSTEPNEYIVSTFPILLDKKDVQDCESDLHVSFFFISLILKYNLQYCECIL